MGIHLSVVESSALDRSYRFTIKESTAGLTAGWRRLVPYDKTEKFLNENPWAVNVIVEKNIVAGMPESHVNLRLIRTKTGNTANATTLACKVIAYASVGDTAMITDLIGTGPNATTSGIFDGALVTQIDGFVGINTDNPSHTLDVSGNVNTSSAYLIGGNVALTSSALGESVMTSNLTTVGNLSSLNVAGNVVAGNVSGAAVSGIDLFGAVRTAAQPHITSVGTLSSLAVTDGVTASSLAGTLQTAAQPNITSLGQLSSLAVAGGVTAFSVTAPQLVVGSVGINVARRGGTSAYWDLDGIGNLGQLTASSLTGTLQTAAQPNITSVGRLNGLELWTLGQQVSPDWVLSLSKTNSATVTYTAANFLNGMPNYESSSTVTTDTTSRNYSDLISIPNVPAGTYFVTFSGHFSSSHTPTAMYYAIYVGSTFINHSERRLFCASGDYHDLVHTQAIVTLSGTTTLSVRYRSETSGKINRCYDRSLCVIQLS